MISSMASTEATTSARSTLATMAALLPVARMNDGSALTTSVAEDGIAA